MPGHHDPGTYNADRPFPVALEPLLTIDAVSKLLGVSRGTVYRLIREGQLRPLRVGARQRFLPADLRSYLALGRGVFREIQ